MKMNYPMIFSGSLLMVDANNPAKSAKIELDFAHPGVLPTDSIVQTAIDNANECLSKNMPDSTQWRPATKGEFFNHVMREKTGAPVRFATPGSEDFEPVDTGDEVRQLQREIKSLKEQDCLADCWIPVSEGLPPNQTECLVFCLDPDDEYVTVAAYQECEGKWVEFDKDHGCYEGCALNVLCWMLLPSPSGDLVRKFIAAQEKSEPPKLPAEDN